MSGTPHVADPPDVGETPPDVGEALPTWSPRRHGRLGAFFGQAGVRFGMIYACLFGASSLALAAFLWWSTAGLLDRQTEAAILVDFQGLTERLAEGGVGNLIETIEQRIAGNIDDDAVYLLVDARMQRLAGNLERWPRGVAPDFDWTNLRIDRGGIRTLARVHHADLEGGLHLLVGRDVESRVQLRGIVADAMLWAAVIAVLLGTVGAMAVRGLFRATLADISATAIAVSAGDLTRRVKVTGHSDEFDLLAETINDMLDRIARLMEGVRQVSNAIAHDLRTPITRARMRLEDAATSARTEADLHQAIERAQADLDGIVAVFQALLRIAEIEAGARRSAFSRVDVAPMLSDMAELYEAAAEEAGQTLVARIPPQAMVFGDRDMIQQAVANLLDNAMKFSPPEGVIRLGAHVAGGSGSAGGVGAGVAAGTVEIVVADDGPGIPPQDRARASQRFFRGEAARSTPGSGLGLALVQAVAMLHGGTLRLEDNAPGLRAVLVLPVGDGANGAKTGEVA
ncbi:MAG: HAMP domain-containing histidine kinase [Acetobacteraceae bacterium]|nr:HAMP domain-containing histidine kinase [Acetobacteraceae bacterium]